MQRQWLYQEAFCQSSSDAGEKRRDPAPGSDGRRRGPERLGRHGIILRDSSCSIVADAQCRINANRGPWQLFARAPLLTRDKDLSQPANGVDTTCWQSFRPDINTAHFYFFVAELMSNYLTTDGLKKILYSWRPSEACAHPPLAWLHTVAGT